MVYTIPADLLDSIPIDHVYHAALSECATINIDWQDVPKHQQDQRWEAFRRRFNEWRQTPSRSLDASSLSQRLSAIADRGSPCPSISTASADYHPNQDRSAAYQHYQGLVDRGGRPSQPIKPIGPCPPPDMPDSYCLHCANHWEAEAGRATAELESWIKFLDYRQRMRTPSKFASYKSHILKYLREESIAWAFELQLDRQSKLDEWREYYLYHLSWLRSKERRGGDQSQPPRTDGQKWARMLIQGRLGMVLSTGMILQDMETEHSQAEARRRGKRKPARGPVRRSERLKSQLPKSLPKLPQRTCRVFKSRKKTNGGSPSRKRLDSLDAYRSATSL